MKSDLLSVLAAYTTQSFIKTHIHTHYRTTKLSHLHYIPTLTNIKSQKDMMELWAKITDTYSPNVHGTTDCCMSHSSKQMECVFHNKPPDVSDNLTNRAKFCSQILELLWHQTAHIPVSFCRRMYSATTKIYTFI